MSRSWSVMREITEGILLRRKRALIRAVLREIRWSGGWLIVGRGGGDSMSEGKERDMLGEGEIRGDILVGGFKISRYRVEHMKLWQYDIF